MELLPNPLVGGRETLIEGGVRLPLEHFFDEGVVGVATGHALRRVELVVAFEFYPGNFFDLADEGVDGNEFAGTKIDRRARLRPVNSQRAIGHPTRQMILRTNPLRAAPAALWRAATRHRFSRLAESAVKPRRAEWRA